MTLSMNIAEARRGLTSFPRRFTRRRDLGAVEVTSRGKPVLAVLSWDLYEGLSETLEIMGDPKLARLLRKSLAEADAGRTIPWERAKERLT